MDLFPFTAPALHRRLASRIVSGVQAFPACTALHALMTASQPPASATSNASLLREMPPHNRPFSPMHSAALLQVLHRRNE